MITDNELLSIELRNKGNADVASLLREIRNIKAEEDDKAYDRGYDAAMKDRDKSQESDDKE